MIFGSRRARQFHTFTRFGYCIGWSLKTFIFTAVLFVDQCEFLGRLHYLYRDFREFPGVVVGELTENHPFAKLSVFVGIRFFGRQCSHIVLPVTQVCLLMTGQRKVAFCNVFTHSLTQSINSLPLFLMYFRCTRSLSFDNFLNTATYFFTRKLISTRTCYVSLLEIYLFADADLLPAQVEGRRVNNYGALSWRLYMLPPQT